MALESVTDAASRHFAMLASRANRPRSVGEKINERRKLIGKLSLRRRELRGPRHTAPLSALPLLALPQGHRYGKGNEAKLTRYKVPDAQRFSTTFCSTCGSPLPREGTDFVVVPAGSLDTVPEMSPQGRIFWDSRSTWSCDQSDLPTFSEYPTA
jgi:hypothetical protein